MLFKDDDNDLKYYCPFCYKEMLRNKEDETENNCTNCKATFWTRALSEEEIEKVFRNRLTNHHD